MLYCIVEFTLTPKSVAAAAMFTKGMDSGREKTTLELGGGSTQKIILIKKKKKQF